MIDDDRTLGPYATAATDVLQPDAVLASQFFDALRGPAHPEGERRLLVAMLEDAVRCFRLGGAAAATTRQKQLLYEQAKQWIVARDESWVFSFDNVCGALGIDAEWLRQGLLASERTPEGAGAIAAADAGGGASPERAAANRPQLVGCGGRRALL